MVYDGLIEGKTVRLRSIEEKDAEVSYNMRNDPKKSKFFHATNGGVEGQLEYIRRQRNKEGDYLFMIEDLNGKAVGMKGLYNYDPQKRTIESGRFIGFGAQVQNMEALMLSFDFAFDVLKVDEIHMDALENNVQMLSIQDRFCVERCGMFYEEDMGCNVISSVLKKEVYYAGSRKKIDALINRFSGR